MREGAGPRVVRSTEAFEDFYREEFPVVAGLAYALSGNRWVAEDLAQEAFLVAHRNWRVVATYDHPGAWVRRVVANLSVSAFRRRVAEAKALAQVIVRHAPTVSELVADDVEFWRAVRSLPRRQAQVVALYYLGDRSVAEVAEILDMASGTVKKHLHDGRRSLAVRLKIQEEEP